MIGSKNVPAPGKGAAAYSASKAALQQLCRIAALEWAPNATRVNIVHPDAVFDTGLWSEELDCGKSLKLRNQSRRIQEKKPSLSRSNV